MQVEFLTQLRLLRVAQVNQITLLMFRMMAFQAMAMAMVILPMTQPLPKPTQTLTWKSLRRQWSMTMVMDLLVQEILFAIRLK